jgi:hypothetical protein
MSGPRFFLRMSFHDNQGNTFGERAIEISSAWSGRRPNFANLKPPSAYFPGELTFNDTVEILQVRELRRKQFIADATRMGMALADYLEDKEGWHGLDRQEGIRKIEDENSN